MTHSQRFSPLFKLISVNMHIPNSLWLKKLKSPRIPKPFQDKSEFNFNSTHLPEFNQNEPKSPDPIPKESPFNTVYQHSPKATNKLRQNPTLCTAQCGVVARNAVNSAFGAYLRVQNSWG